MRDKSQVIEEVKDLMTSFARDTLSKEEEGICLHIWEELARKRTLDITRTQPNIWAAAVIWSFCRANFKHEEGVTLDLLCSFLNTKKSTIGNKASGISRMLKIDFFNPEFTTDGIQEQNPLNRLTLTNDGLVVPRETVSSFEEELVTYRRLRVAQKDLHSKLLKLLPNTVVQECGKALGVYYDGELVFGSMSEIDVLFDYCIYDYRWGGHNVIERYVDQSPESGSDQDILLKAMLQPRYSLFQIDEVVDGVGVQTRDLFRGDRGFVVDVGLSETADKGLILGLRIISPGDGRFFMTTGAGLPVDRPLLERIGTEIPDRFGKTTEEIAQMSPEKAAEFSASIIRVLLAGDMASYIAFEDHVPAWTAEGGFKVDRNDPCPCGSGKKYKKCHGR